MEKSRKADLAIVGLAFIWGSTFSLVKNALNDLSPFVYNSIRFTLASIIYWVIFRNKLRSFDKPLIKAGLLTGLFMALGYAFQTLGLFYTTASKSAFITGISVIFVPFFLIIIQKTLPSLLVIYCAIQTLVGLRMMTLSGSNYGINIGDIFTLICAAAYAMHLICVKIFTEKYDYIKLTFFQLIVTALLNTLAIPLFEIPRFNLTYNTVSAILITSVFCSALAVYIFNRVQKHTSATNAAIIFTTEPVFAALVAYLFYGERMGVVGIFGAGLILTGVILSELKKPQ